MILDARIKITREQSKMIGEIICTEIKKSIKENDSHYKKAKRCENQYAQITKYIEAGKVCDNPWPGAADYFVPMSEWVVDAVHARVMNVLFSQEPYMTARGVESSDVPKQDGVTDFVDMAFREIVKLRDNIEFYFKQVIKIPTAVIKFDWAQDYDKQIVKATAVKFVNPADGSEEYILPDEPDAMVKMAEYVMNGWQQQGQEDVWAEKDVKIEDGAKLQYVKFSDYVWSPSAKKDARPYWEGDRFWLTLNQMRLKAMQEKFDKDAVDAVVREMGGSDKTAVEKAIAEREELRECFHYYGRLPFNKSNEIDFQDSEAYEQEVHIVVDYKAKEVLAVEHWPYRRVPYPNRVYIRQSFEDTEEFIGRSLLEKLYMTQKELNSFHNTIMNNAWLSMQKIFVKKKTLVGDEWDRPEVYPGAMWEVDNPGDIQTLSVGDVKSIGWELEQSFLGFAERLSNISIYQTGTARQQGGNKTLGEVEATIGEGNIGLDRFIQRCHNVLRLICQWTVDYYIERMPPGLERKIRGQNGDLVFPENGAPGEWQSDDLAGQFDFVWNGTSLNADKKWKIAVANDLMDRYMKVPMVAGNLLSVWQICKDGLVARGIKDWQNYLPPKDAIVVEMRNMQAQKQAQQAAAQAPSVEQKAVQQLQQAGMPPQQAIAAVKERLRQGA